ncbi:MAG: HD domain-containing protein [Planctomycetota bacterium]|nr:HD domain-containing protein [Planctomycetota bacterium]
METNINTTLVTTLSSLATPQQRTRALLDFMEAHGKSFYDESVTQLEHAIQAATLAREENVPTHQVVAALLHDIGHFLMDEHDQKSNFLVEDWCHEDVGAEQLGPFFDKHVIEPIRLHVPAKRYLCTADASYYESLSAASKRSFQLQGGPLSPEELTDFEAHEHYETAVRLRRWDDRSKVKGLKTPELNDFYNDLVECMRPGE